MQEEGIKMEKRIINKKGIYIFPTHSLVWYDKVTGRLYVKVNNDNTTAD